MLFVAQPLTGLKSRCQGFKINPDSGFLALSEVILKIAMHGRKFCKLKQP
jgi:hypothetical protein